MVPLPRGSSGRSDVENGPEENDEKYLRSTTHHPSTSQKRDLCDQVRRKGGPWRCVSYRDDASMECSSQAHEKGGAVAVDFSYAWHTSTKLASVVVERFWI